MGIKLTSHWSLQNIRVSSKKHFRKFIRGLWGYQHYAMLTTDLADIVHPVRYSFQYSGTVMRAAPCSRVLQHLARRGQLPAIMSREKCFGAVFHKNINIKHRGSSKAMNGSQSVDPRSIASAYGSLLECRLLSPSLNLLKSETLGIRTNNSGS